MPATLECYLCLLRQSLEAARYATRDEKIQRHALEEGMRLVLAEGLDAPPPIIGRAIHRLIKEITGNPDPYLAEKKRFNDAMLAQLPRMRRLIDSADDPFSMAVKLSIAGNSIDAALGTLSEAEVDAAFERAVSQPLTGDYKQLKEAVEEADSILFLTDNAGEIVCDTLLVEHLANKLGKDLLVAVRGVPILNDATMEDAQYCGMSKLVPVISNGNDGLGTFLFECSDEFLRSFVGVDLVIAKGLANYETLVENSTRWQPKQIAFLFKAKCPFIAKFTETSLGDLVVRVK